VPAQKPFGDCFINRGQWERASHRPAEEVIDGVRVMLDGANCVAAVAQEAREVRSNYAEVAGGSSPMNACAA
jgi:hypothetical protein